MIGEGQESSCLVIYSSLVFTQQLALDGRGLHAPGASANQFHHEVAKLYISFQVCPGL